MLKKNFLTLFTCLLTISSIRASERVSTMAPTQLNKYFAAETAPLSVGQLEERANYLNTTRYDKPQDEYFRLTELATLYAKLRNAHRGRGQGQIHKQYETLHTQYNQAAIQLNNTMLAEELTNAKIENIRDQIKNILHDETIKKVAQRWFKTKLLFEQLAALSENKVPDIHQEALGQLKHIQNIQFQEETINRIRQCSQTNNKAGMILGYKTLRTTADNPRHIQTIDDRIVSLQQEIVEEQTTQDLSNTILAMQNQNASRAERYNNVIGYCHTLSHSENDIEKKFGASQELKYQQRIAYLEMLDHPELTGNELIRTAYHETIACATDVADVRSIKVMIADSTAGIMEEDTPEITTFASLQVLGDAESRVKDILKNKVSQLPADLDKNFKVFYDEVTRAQAIKNKKASDMIALANAYHERAEFNQKHYPETRAAQITRDRYDARSNGLQAYNKDKNAQKQLKFTI